MPYQCKELKKGRDESESVSKRKEEASEPSDVQFCMKHTKKKQERKRRCEEEAESYRSEQDISQEF